MAGVSSALSGSHGSATRKAPRRVQANESAQELPAGVKFNMTLKLRTQSLVTFLPSMGYIAKICNRARQRLHAPTPRILYNQRGL